MSFPRYDNTQIQMVTNCNQLKMLAAPPPPTPTALRLKAQCGGDNSFRCRPALV